MRRAAFTSEAVAVPVVAAFASTQKRHKSLYQRLHSLTEIKLANMNEGKQYTSKDLTSGPQYGAGFDPVFSHYFFGKMTGPLRRKLGTTPDDYLNVDEAEKWMDAKQAAKALEFKESDLPKLTRTQLEERWAKLYSERTHAKQQEVLIATEVLLEYLDSSLAVKKSRQYYRKTLDNARLAIDQELDQAKRERNSKFIWFCGILALGTSFAVMFVAYSRQYLTRSDVNAIGTMTQDYMNMTFLQPTNLEPKPDYSTRYLTTPTSMEIDKKSGRYDMQFIDSAEVRMLEEKAAYDRHEEAEMLKLLNDENERVSRTKQDDIAQRSRVTVYLPEELDADGLVQEKKAEREPKATFQTMNFRQFANMMANNFGGGSRLQRITSETSARAAELETIKKRTVDSGQER